MTARAESFTPGAGRTGRAARVPAYVLELGFAAVALSCYLLVRWYAGDRTAEAVHHARDLLDLEQRLGMDWEHEVQDTMLAVPGLEPVVTQFYTWAYFPTLLVLAVWLYRTHREAYRRLRNALLASGVVGLVVYATWPCAPPWIGGVGFTDTVSSGAFESVARPAGITNHLGAVPSFHVGWVILVAVAVHRVARTRQGRLLATLHPAAMAYAVVATGNHWVLDVPAGLLLALAGLALAALADRVDLGRSPRVSAITSDPRPRRAHPGEDAGDSR